MARGSSIHFRPVPAGGLLAIAHNTREIPPRDVLPAEHHLGNISVVYGDVEATHRAKMALASPKARATKNYSPLAEGVLNLPDPPADRPCAEVDEWKRDMERRVREFCPEYERLSGHRVLRADIHLDEGHIREDGSVGYNAHAHIVADKTDERGRVVRMERRQLGADGKETMVGDRRARGQRLQDLAAEITGLERGEQNSRRKHIPSAAYRELARQGRVLSRDERDRLTATGQQQTDNTTKAEQWAARAENRVDDAEGMLRDARARAEAHVRERDEARQERDQARASAATEITEAEIAAAKAELVEHIRQTRGSTRVESAEQLGEIYDSLRAQWKAENAAAAAADPPKPHSQRDYSALRLVHAEMRAQILAAERDDARRERDQVWRARDQARAEQAGAKADTVDVTDAEIAAARSALEEHARANKIPLQDRERIKRGYDQVRRQWVADNAAAAASGRQKPHSQRDYSALRLAQQQMQAEISDRRAERERTKRRRDRRVHEARERQRDGFATGGISGQPLRQGCRSAELAAAQELGLRYQWDEAARVKRYRDRAGSELFTVQRKLVTLTRHDAAAEYAALRLAVARFGGRVEIRGSAAFRERMARAAAREGIEVADADLQYIVRDEQTRMARGERPDGRPEGAQQQPQKAEQDGPDEQDLGR